MATGCVIALCFAVRAHYRSVARATGALYRQLEELPLGEPKPVPPLDAEKPTAAVLVGTYGGLGIHAVMNVLRHFPGYFGNLVFISVGTSIGVEAVAEAEALCVEVARDFPRTVFFAGKVIFQRERWYQRFLHNDTAFAIEKRLQWRGHTMMILPARIE